MEATAPKYRKPGHPLGHGDPLPSPPPWKDRNPERYQANRKRGTANQRARYPEKYKARSLVASAVASGKLVKPADCQECKTPTAKELLHGHHYDGYDKPLSVQWLCLPCHQEAHRKLNPAPSLEDKRKEYLAAFSALTLVPHPQNRKPGVLSDIRAF